MPKHDRDCEGPFVASRFEWTTWGDGVHMTRCPNCYNYSGSSRAKAVYARCTNCGYERNWGAVCIEVCTNKIDEFVQRNPTFRHSGVCSHCTGQQKVSCGNCSGLGTEGCVACTGTGVKTCGTCSGSGTRTVQNNCNDHNSWDSHYWCQTHGNFVNQYH